MKLDRSGVRSCDLNGLRTYLDPVSRESVRGPGELGFAEFARLGPGAQSCRFSLASTHSSTKLVLIREKSLPTPTLRPWRRARVTLFPTQLGIHSAWVDAPANGEKKIEARRTEWHNSGFIRYSPGTFRSFPGSHERTFSLPIRALRWRILFFVAMPSGLILACSFAKYPPRHRRQRRVGAVSRSSTDPSSGVHFHRQPSLSRSRRTLLNFKQTKASRRLRPRRAPLARSPLPPLGSNPRPNQDRHENHSSAHSKPRKRHP